MGLFQSCFRIPAEFAGEGVGVVAVRQGPGLDDKVIINTATNVIPFGIAPLDFSLK